MRSDLNMFHGKMAAFVSFSFFAFTLVIKLKNFDFESHWNTLIFFDQQKMISDLNVPFQKVSGSWFKLRCLSTILAIS